MYKNLEAELARRRITRVSVSKKLNLRYATVLEKMNGKSRFFFDEAKLIQESFFPDLSLEYLFQQNEEREVHKS